MKIGAANYFNEEYHEKSYAQNSRIYETTMKRDVVMPDWISQSEKVDTSTEIVFADVHD